jgi:hypothetical protein
MGEKEKTNEPKPENCVSFRGGFSAYLERGQFFLIIFIGKSRWSFNISVQIHHHFANFDKCVSLNLGKNEDQFLAQFEAF